MTGAPASAAGDSGSPVPPGPPGDTPQGPVSLWNAANLLTMIRLLLVPGFIALMLADGGYDPAWRSLAWAAFAIAMITDLFDGHVARTYGLVTDFGKIADPIADKAIMGAALICLSALGELPWWVTGVILGRELGITLLRFWVIRYGVIPASRGGKLKTLAQGTAVGMYVLALTGPLATLRFWVMGVAVVLTVGTGLDYVNRAVLLRRQGRRRERAATRPVQGDGGTRPPGATREPASGPARQPVPGAAAAPPGAAAEPRTERAAPPATGAGQDAPPPAGAGRDRRPASGATEAGAELAAGQQRGQEPSR